MKYLLLILLPIVFFTGCKNKNSAKSLVAVLEEETGIKFETNIATNDINTTIAFAVVKYDKVNAMNCEKIKNIVDKHLEMLPINSKEHEWNGAETCNNYNWENPNIEVGYEICIGRSTSDTSNLEARLRIQFSEK